MNLPNNQQLESQFIGQSILERRIISRELVPADFYYGDYRAAWMAIQELDETQQEIEPFGVLRLAARENLKVSDLLQAAHGLVMADDMQPLIAELKELARRRYLIRNLDAALDALQTRQSLTGIMADLSALCENDPSHGVSGFVSLASVIENEVKPALDDLVKGQSRKIKTGFNALDAAIGGGLTPSDVVLVVSDTGSGKSAFVLQLADQLAAQGIPIAFVSGEMRNKENGFRLLSQNSNTTNLNSLMRISVNDRDLLEGWCDIVAKRPMYFDDMTGDLRQLKLNLKILVKQKGIRVLVIDYIQLYKLTANDKFQRSERLAEVSQEIKRMANEFNLCVIEVAQFNREGAKKDEPTMHDLEGSGQLEKDTSLILIIDRAPESSNIAIRIAKGRNSGRCTIPGFFNGQYLKFEL